MSVAENIARIRDLIGATKVTLIAVTKTVESNRIEQAFNCGVTEYGENRVQDALKKQGEMPPHMADKIHWHLIGHLQTNKVKKVVGRFALIHSIDSMHLAEEVSREAEKLGVVQPVLLQAKVVPDPGKAGYEPDQLKSDFDRILALPNLRVRGLMTMAPLTDNVATQRACFNGLRQLRDELQKNSNVPLEELSMGMTDDWQVAIECGATMVRIGRGIFGERAA
jgi:pyridoxal phosphate enzyme (YggS family)